MATKGLTPEHIADKLIETLERELAAARDNALEEAAIKCDERIGTGVPGECQKEDEEARTISRAIRALKSNQNGDAPKEFLVMLLVTASITGSRTMTCAGAGNMSTYTGLRSWTLRR